MLSNPVALAGGDFERGFDVATRIIAPINPLRDSQLAIQEDQQVWMDEFIAGPPVLISDRLEQGRAIFLGRSSDRPTQRNFLVRPIAGQDGGTIGGIE